MPLMPFAAWPYSTALSTSVCGAWSVAIASAVPSRRAARQAAASSGARSGGLTRVAVAYGPATSAPSAHGSPARLPGPAPRAGDPFVRQGKVMRRHVAGDGQAGRLRATDQVKRLSRGEMRQVQPCPRLVANDIRKDGQIAPDCRRLGSGRPAAQPQHGRHEPVVRLGALGLRRILWVIDDRQPQGPGVRQRRPQDRGGPDRRPVVREADDPRVRQLPEGRETFPSPSGRDRPDRQQLDRRPGGHGGGSNRRQHARLIQRRRRVRHRADRREPAVRRRRQPARDGLGILVAGLAQVRVQVREPGRDDDPVGGHAIGIGAVQPCQRFEDPVADDDLARPLAARQPDRRSRPG